MNKKNINCYMCDNIATSHEHVPPQCLFPKMKEIDNGKDYRKSLIRVPSCDEHNSKKSSDDEYLRNILSSCFLSDSINSSSLRSANRKYPPGLRTRRASRNYSSNTMGEK